MRKKGLCVDTSVLGRFQALLGSPNTETHDPSSDKPVAYQYRTFHADNTVSPGWTEWELVTPRNPHVETVEDRVHEIQSYINAGYKYELRALYAIPLKSERKEQQRVV
jgi:hypothetical protein